MRQVQPNTASPYEIKLNLLLQKKTEGETEHKSNLLPESPSSSTADLSSPAVIEYGVKTVLCTN